MLVIEYDKYWLILSDNPCYVFEYFNVEQMHGLNKRDCEIYDNTSEDAYMAGWCNYSPIDDKLFLFINTSRCTDDVKTTGLVMHETTHLACRLYDLNSQEEEAITYAEQECYKIVSLIKNI